MRKILLTYLALFVIFLIFPPSSFAQNAAQCQLHLPEKVEKDGLLSMTASYQPEGGLGIGQTYQNNNFTSTYNPTVQINGATVTDYQKSYSPQGDLLQLTISNLPVPSNLAVGTYPVKITYKVTAGNETSTVSCSASVNIFDPNQTPPPGQNGGSDSIGTSGTNNGTFTTVIKPLKLQTDDKGNIVKDSKGNDQLANYSTFSAELALDPKWINEGDTRVVDVYFLNIPKGQNDSRKPDKYNYYVCLESDRVECEKRPDSMIKVEGDKFSINKYNLPADADVKAVYGDSDSMISLRVCGNGDSSVKAGVSNCFPYKDVWFHGSKFYRIGLYENDRKTLVGEATFYSKKYYPNVYIATHDQPSDFKLAASTNEKLLTNPNFGYIKNTTNPAKQTFLPPKGFLLFGGNLFVQLTGLHHASGYDQNQNDYQIVIEGQTHKYKSVKCITVRDKSPEIPSGRNANDIQSFDIGESGEKLGPGQYLLKINEEENERKIRSDGCSGGFTYWYIYFDITANKNGQQQLTIKRTTQDPNGSDVNFQDYDTQLGPGKLPCVNADGTPPKDPTTLTSCDYIHIPVLGNIATEPTAFLKSLLQTILGLAGVIIIFIFILNGYRLLTSAGDKQKVADARERITSAIVGLIFILFALIIMQFITVDILQLPGFTK